MKWSWKIGRFAGVDTHVHASFLLLVAWAAWAAYSGAGTGLAAVLGVLFLLAVFGSVLLHELGHALVARRYGIHTRRIVLLPIGGIAQLEGQPQTPRQELAIALAGPAVNFAIAAVLFVLSGLVGAPSGWGLLGSLMFANLALGLFNLLPAFPMDGGRALRAILATRVGGRRATEVAAYIGKVAAIAFGIIGLFTNPMLVIIAVFIWFAANAELANGTDVYDHGWEYANAQHRRRGEASSWWPWRKPRLAGAQRSGFGRRSHEQIVYTPYDLAPEAASPYADVPKWSVSGFGHPPRAPRGPRVVIVLGRRYFVR
jgi:Zn-dependent protease